MSSLSVPGYKNSSLPIGQKQKFGKKNKEQDEKANKYLKLLSKFLKIDFLLAYSASSWLLNALWLSHLCLGLLFSALGFSFSLKSKADNVATSTTFSSFTSKVDFIHAEFFFFFFNQFL